MSIKPIDLQVNISQMSEVAKGEQVRNDGIIEKQHVLEKDSDEKSKLVQSRLEENKKAEKAAIKREEEKTKKKKEKNLRANEDKKDSEESVKGKLIDDRLGNIIDIKK